MRKAVVVLPFVPVIPMAERSLLSGWARKEGGGGLREGAAAVLDFEDGQAGLEDEEMIEGGRGVGDDAECAGGEGLVDVAVAVG